jgi:hypothetical protein
MSDTHTEALFEVEAALRRAAEAYFRASNATNAKALRAAAIAYAEAANEVDAAVDAMREGDGG